LATHRRAGAICDLAHQRIAFGDEHARVTRTTSEAYQENECRYRMLSALKPAQRNQCSLSDVVAQSVGAHLSMDVKSCGVARTHQEGVAEMRAI